MDPRNSQPLPNNGKPADRVEANFFNKRGQQVWWPVSNYYSNPDIRARMMEFLGGESLEDVTCEYLTALPRGLQSLDDHRGRVLQQFVAKVVVLFAIELVSFCA